VVRGGEVLDGDLGEVGRAGEDFPAGLFVEDFFCLLGWLVRECIGCFLVGIESRLTVLMCISLVLAGLRLPASLV